MFRVRNALLCVAAGVLLLMAVSCAMAKDANEAIMKKTSPDPFEFNKRLGRGVNLGNALDAPKEGEWGVILEEEYFQAIKEAGFDSVRLPVRWSAHALKDKPYTIDPNFFDRVDWAINCALSRNLPVILNDHHYNELYNDPNGQSERFLALWEQIAEHYKGYPDTLVFELINEPQKNLNATCWNELLKKALTIVRKSNPHRTIVIDPAEYSVIEQLEKLNIPEEDRNIIISIHYYKPMEFTHQGAGWAGERSKLWMGTKWMGTNEQKQVIIDAFDKVAAWGKKHNRPINLGEFGAYVKADKDSRVRWTTFVAKSARQHGFSYHYWEFCHENFGAYDQQTSQWKDYLLNALIPQ